MKISNDIEFQIEVARQLRHSRKAVPTVDATALVEKTGALATALRRGLGIAQAAVALAVVAHRLAVADPTPAERVALSLAETAAA